MATRLTANTVAHPNPLPNARGSALSPRLQFGLTSSRLTDALRRNRLRRLDLIAQHEFLDLAG